MAGYISRRFTCVEAVTHPSSNRAQPRVVNYVDQSQRANHYYAAMSKTKKGGIGLSRV